MTAFCPMSIVQETVLHESTNRRYYTILYTNHSLVLYTNTHSEKQPAHVRC